MKLQANEIKSLRLVAKYRRMDWKRNTDIVDELQIFVLNRRAVEKSKNGTNGYPM